MPIRIKTNEEPSDVCLLSSWVMYNGSCCSVVVGLLGFPLLNGVGVIIGTVIAGASGGTANQFKIIIFCKKMG